MSRPFKKRDGGHEQRSPTSNTGQVPDEVRLGGSLHNNLFTAVNRPSNMNGVPRPQNPDQRAMLLLERALQQETASSLLNSLRSSQLDRSREISNSFSFPQKLNAMLSNPLLTRIVSWMPHGRSWKVHEPRAFAEEVLPIYFGKQTYNSFVRLLGDWGFKRISKGPDRDSFYHELFLQGLPELHVQMCRAKKQTDRSSAFLQVEHDPNLYARHALPSSQYAMLSYLENRERDFLARNRLAAPGLSSLGGPLGLPAAAATVAAAAATTGFAGISPLAQLDLGASVQGLAALANQKAPKNNDIGIISAQLASIHQQERNLALAALQPSLQDRTSSIFSKALIPDAVTLAAKASATAGVTRINTAVSPSKKQNRKKGQWLPPLGPPSAPAKPVKSDDGWMIGNPEAFASAMSINRGPLKS